MTRCVHLVKESSQRVVGVPTHSTSRRGAREERGQRILDAASELILRWGYDKTTIDDVARRAGVAKGTVYLHWKNRDALFVALLRRERLALLADVRERVGADREGPTLGVLLRHITVAYLRSPLLKAVVMRDMDVIGKLARSKHAGEAGSAVRSDFITYLEVLRENGLVRTDLGLAEQVHLLSAVFMGFIITPPVLPAEYALSDDASADLLAEALCRTLDPGRPLTSEEAATLARATVQYLDDAVEVAEQKYRSLLGPDPTNEENAE